MGRFKLDLYGSKFTILIPLVLIVSTISLNRLVFSSFEVCSSSSIEPKELQTTLILSQFREKTTFFAF